jgi:hypothetical protein
LENVKGVYLIVDKSNGKMYVGSAYGDTGIWCPLHLADVVPDNGLTESGIATFCWGDHNSLRRGVK